MAGKDHYWMKRVINLGHLNQKVSSPALVARFELNILQLR